nr:MAG TPA: hypothetical protein [Caudoviricetes sp.]
MFETKNCKLQREIATYHQLAINLIREKQPHTSCRLFFHTIIPNGNRCTSIRRHEKSRDGGGGRNPLRLSRLFFCESHQFIRGKRLLEQTAHRRSWSKLSHCRAATQKRNWLPRSRVDCTGCI